MFRAFSLALLIAWAHSASASSPLADPAGEVLAEVQRWLDGTHDLSGEFEQELLSGALGTGTEESGQWYLRRPGQLRFDYHAPETKVALVNGDETLFWVEQDEQTVRGRLDEGQDLLVALLVGGRPLRDLFVPSIDVEPAPRGRVRLRLVPVLREEAFTELILTVRKNGGALDAVEVLDAAGNRIFYRFPVLRRNTGLSPDVFLFEPPDAPTR